MSFADPVVRGVLWGDWRRYRVPLLVLPLILLGIWILLAPSSRPESTDLNFAFAFLGAAIAATFGVLPGTDVHDGTEEFILSLPPRRSTRFRVRLIVGLIVLAAVQVLGWATLASAWPWKLWALLPVHLPEAFVDPPGSVPAGHPGHVLFGFAAPFAVFASAFCAGMMRRPGRAGFILEPSIALLTLFAAYFWVKPMLDSWPGVVCSGLLLAFGAARIALGYREYSGKESGVSAGWRGIRDPVMVVILALVTLTLLGLLALGALAFLLLQTPAR